MDIVSSVAASRLAAQQRTMDVIAGNVANSNTPGFKAERVQFSDWLSRQQGVDAPRGGESIAFTQDRATWREQQAGTLSHTGNPFDLAITGDGYFTVSTPRGPRLTRNGRFGLLPDGKVADNEGNALLNTAGKPIQLALTDTRIAIAGDGTLSSENGQLTRVGVVRPTDTMRITAEGAALFRADSPTSLVALPNIVQGAVEDSNVQPVMEMTRMIELQRQFQFVSQLIQAEADRQQSAIDKLLPRGS